MIKQETTKQTKTWEGNKSNTGLTQKKSKDEDGSFTVVFDKVNKCHTFLKIPYTRYAWWGLSSSLLFENIADQ